MEKLTSIQCMVFAILMFTVINTAMIADIIRSQQ
jgi:hypothetical protein